jgi:integrase
MLLLMATYGFGGAEVVQLSLDAVDWHHRVVRARRPKTGRDLELPLLPSVARALAVYVRDERPSPTLHRRLFVSTRLPYGPLTTAAIRHRMQMYARRAGLDATGIGAHTFRHSHATRQIDAGAHPQVVGEILGHRRPQSTSAYIRVAMRRLRRVALPVPR